jgi:diguanylate cyclase (GGDEF)-like protein
MDSYLSALLALSRMVSELCPQVGAPYEDRILRLRRRLAFDATPANLAETRASLEADLADYTSKARSYWCTVWDEAHDMLVVAKENAETLAARQEFFAGRLCQFADDMEQAVLHEDIEQLHAAFALQAAGLRECVDAMTREMNGLLSRFTARLNGLERGFGAIRAGETPRAEFLDRGDMGRILDNPGRSLADYGFVIFQIDQLAEIRKTLGRAAGDQVVREFGQRLLDRIRATDHVVRWSDDQFLAVINGSPHDARNRTAQIHFWLEGRYPVLAGDQPGHVDLTVQIRYVDPEPGETREHLFQRLNQPPAAPLPDARTA